MPKKPKKERDYKLLRDGIEQDLKDQLDRNGTVGKHYFDLVDDYMRLWDVKNMLVNDIQTRGATINTISPTVHDKIKKAGLLLELIDVTKEALEGAISDEQLRVCADVNSRAIALIHDSAIVPKKNDSVADLLKTNAQMLKLLSELGIKPVQTDGDGADDEM